MRLIWKYFLWTLIKYIDKIYYIINKSSKHKDLLTSFSMQGYSASAHRKSHTDCSSERAGGLTSCPRSESSPLYWTPPRTRGWITTLPPTHPLKGQHQDKPSILIYWNFSPWWWKILKLYQVSRSESCFINIAWIQLGRVRWSQAVTFDQAPRGCMETQLLFLISHSLF